MIGCVLGRRALCTHAYSSRAIGLAKQCPSILSGPRPRTSAPTKSRISLSYSDDTLTRLYSTRPSRSDLSIEDFESLAKAGLAKPEDTLDCFWKSRKDIEALAPTQRQAECSKQKVGARILLRMWSDQDLWKGSEEQKSVIAAHLCWHLIREGSDEFIWSWIFLVVEEYRDHLGEPGQDDFPDRAFALNLLGHLINQQWRWHDPDPVPSLLCFKRAVEGLSQATIPNRKHFLISLCDKVRKIMTSNRCLPYDGELFEMVDRTQTQVLSSKMLLAKFKLFHPYKPDPEPLLRMVLKDQDDWAEPSAWEERYNSLVFFRASYILAKQARYDDAVRLLNEVRLNAPKVWTSVEKTDKELSRDPKLDFVRQLRKGVALP